MKEGIIAFFIILLNNFKAQDTNFVARNTFNQVPNNSFYLELVGSTYGLGLSYERAISKGENGIINVRFGMGTIYFVSALPTIGVNGLIGNKKSYMELGFNFNRNSEISFLGKTDESRVYWIGNPVGGYRYIGENGFILRITFSPIVNIFNADIGPKFVPLFGLSFGKAFN
jgi:hypothetical protein